MNLEYKQKYLKYKNKYLSLKLELEGGKKTQEEKVFGMKEKYLTSYYLYKKGGASFLKKTRDNAKDVLEDSRVKMNVLVIESNNQHILWEEWHHLLHANFEYLEKKYGGRFDKKGIFKKGEHLDKKGNYKPHSKGLMSGKYYEYFGKLKTWEEEMNAGKKFFEEPKLLKDKESIFDNLDYYRANFINGSFMFDEDSYKWIDKWYNNTPADLQEYVVLKTIEVNSKELICERLHMSAKDYKKEFDKVFTEDHLKLLTPRSKYLFGKIISKAPRFTR